ncbi:MAG: VOC family protein [Thermostichus sp. HHBFW_bins_43]
MVLTGLFHVAIKTNDLEITVRFYTQVMGMRQVPRPNFGFPGAWLACPTPENAAIFHIYAGGPALGRTGVAPQETGAVDHISLQAVGFHEFKRRITRLGLSCREFIVPGTSLWQLFVYDPNGVLLELTFDGQAEADPLPDLSPGRAYVAGDPFFDPKEYQVLMSRSLHGSPA